jgi:excisionase family DNA binding protein
LVEQQEQSLVVGVAKAAQMLDISDAQTYKLIDQGKLQATKIGRDWKIIRASIYSLVGLNEQQPPAGENTEAK